MDWIGALRGSVVGLDTAPIIYYVEANPHYLSTIDPFFDALARSEFETVTSMISLIESLVHPIRTGDAVLADRYRALLLNTAGITTLPVAQPIAEIAAELRATYTVRTPDAIQLATAIRMGASTFVTNDGRLPRISGLNIVVLDDVMASGAGHGTVSIP